MKKVKINFKEVKVTDLDGNLLIVKDFVKIAANGLFTSAPTIELSDFARQLHKGETVEIDEESLKQMVAVFSSKQMFYPFAQLPLVEYLKAKLNGK